MGKLIKLFQDTSALYGGNAAFIEDLYERYLDNPEAVEKSWQKTFSEMRRQTAHEIPHRPVIERFSEIASASSARLAVLQGFTEDSVKKQSAVARLIDNYRAVGHRMADNNPLQKPPASIPDLEPANYGLAEPDMDTWFDIGMLQDVDRLRLRDIIATLKKIYCGSIGTEYMHIVDTDVKRWIKNRLEGRTATAQIGAEKKRQLLELLTAAEGIEKYLHRKYVGQKRFSLEGGECLIPILDELIQRAGSEHGTQEIVIGMAHRGRLNVLINILGKKPATLFGEFEGTSSFEPGAGSGDVKYHLGFSSNIETSGGPVHIALAFNPSHLEIINPVVEGSVKARQDRYGPNSINTVMPILIHGDASFAGQGIVMETLNMAETRAFSTGGTIHIIVNNQIGFTTSHPLDARSTLYCTDVANMVQAPVFHVNGNDPEAVLFVTQMAVDFRMAFNRDVVIDLICYRRHGHNEADEPAATQPAMYKKIRNLPTTRQIYAQQLQRENILSEEQCQAMDERYQQLLEGGEIVARGILLNFKPGISRDWQKYLPGYWDMPHETAVSLERIRFCNDRLQQLPPGFELHPRVAKIMESRRKMAAGAAALDWGFAENMAYATLLLDGYNLRLTGEDTGRGTFFHRHAVLHNQLNGENYIPLKHLDDVQGHAQIFDSLLSEAGVLGFEYGYSTTEPETLVIWEAQFGDFANCAQVVIDQFISSGETKWGRMSGLTLLLPHGFEGQGPEHSSARLERFLQLCAEHNMQICMPTTPAQIFHLLRRQMLRPYRKPLIIMSPKSLLRHKLAVSTLEDLSSGKFHPLIGEIDNIPEQQVKRLILCAGKIYYDLVESRRHDNLDHVAIVRLEQLYPFPETDFRQQMNNYPHLESLVWCQEEPQNQGAWYQIRHHFVDCIAPHIQLYYAGRPPSAAPAVGSLSIHIEQQNAVVKSALYGTDIRN
ncbi:MAG: 2-oxoglutarate dehydrogenase E1 component [Gammaproteobacteria bacterium]